MKPYMPIVVEILNKQAPSTILDAPSGEGWLWTMLKFDTKIDGIDFFERIFGLPQMLYCRNKYNKSKTKEEEIFWLCLRELMIRFQKEFLNFHHHIK